MKDEELKNYIENVVCTYTITLFSALLEVTNKILKNEAWVDAKDVWNKFAKRNGACKVIDYKGD